MTNVLKDSPVDYTFDITSGLYYEPAFGFYYNTKTKLHYNSHNACYYKWDAVGRSFVRTEAPKKSELQDQTALTKVPDAQQQSPWKKVIDPSTGAPYYFNTKTNTSQWTVPEDFVDAKKLPQQQHQGTMKDGLGGSSLTSNVNKNVDKVSMNFYKSNTKMKMGFSFKKSKIKNSLRGLDAVGLKTGKIGSVASVFKQSATDDDHHDAAHKAELQEVLRQQAHRAQVVYLYLEQIDLVKNLLFDGKTH